MLWAILLAAVALAFGCTDLAAPECETTVFETIPIRSTTDSSEAPIAVTWEVRVCDGRRIP